MTTDSAGQGPIRPLLRGRALIDELHREKDVQPIVSPKDPAGAGIFESSELQRYPVGAAS